MSWRLLSSIMLLMASFPIKNEEVRLALRVFASMLALYEMGAGIYWSVKEGKAYILPKAQDGKLLLIAFAGLIAIVTLGSIFHN